MDITKELKKLEDSKYKEFEAKLIPNIRKEEIIGVRVPQIRNLSKIIPKEDKIKFINDIPHKYHEENLLNAIIINGIKDYDKCIIKVNEFIPYINNWSVCDTLNPKVFKKNKDKLILEVDNWIKSEKTYIQRFALLMIMRNFLDDDFKKEYLDYPIIIENDDYYIKMAKAWFYCEALIKKWDFAIKYIEERKLDKWVLNKAIQKSIESFRISDDKKRILEDTKNKMKDKYEFDAIIHEVKEKGGAYVIFPWNIKEEFGKARIKVNAEFDGIKYSGSIVNMGLKDKDGNVLYIIGVLKSIRNKLSKKQGDTIHVVIKPIIQ